MGIKKLAMLAALGLSMASAPVLAQTSAAERSAPILFDANAQDEESGTSTTTYVIAFFVILAIGLGIYAATDEGNPGQTSP
jgi:hypothetical protein